MPRNPGGTVSGFKLLSTPDAPTITGVTTSIGSASVAFTAPTDTGDGAITSYVVTAVDESSGASTGGTGTSSPITVSPPAGGTFKIRMQALNPYGPGRLTEYDTGNEIYGGAELWAWGNNIRGTVGDNTIVNRSSPVQVGALTTWSQVSSGSTHAAAVRSDNTLWSWGRGEHGKIGDDSIIDRSSPVQVGALTDWKQVSAGSEHTVAVKTTGTLWAWGRSGDGQLGIGVASSTTRRSSPVQVGALTNWSSVSAGFANTLSVKSDGTLWSWGGNGSGEIGDNTVISRSSPVQIGALTDWSQSSSGTGNGAALRSNGTLWSWGANGFGQIGDNTVVASSSPVQIGLTDWAQVATGDNFAVAVKTTGTIWSWGRNSDGRLGLNDIDNRSSPVQIGALTNWTQVSAGSSAARANSVKSDKTIWSWGSNGAGQIGDNTIFNRSSPVQIGSLSNWTSSATGGYVTLALYGVV